MRLVLRRPLESVAEVAVSRAGEVNGASLSALPSLFLVDMNSSEINGSFSVYSHYKNWVRKNPQSASDVEAIIKWLSYFIAGKINKSVILTELVYSTSNLLVLFNDITLQSFKSELNSVSDKIKIWLSVLEYSEVFLEVSSKTLWGEKGKWIIIICIQALKCLAKMTLLLVYKEKLITCPAIMPYKRNSEKHCDTREGFKGISTSNSANHGVAFCLKRSGRIIRKVETAPSLHNRLWKSPSMPVPWKETSAGHTPRKAVFRQKLIGEVLFTIKPLITLGIIMKYGQSAWKPWLISAFTDLASLFLLHSESDNCGPGEHLTADQRLEMSRRRLALFLYLMRSPFYEKHTEERLDGFLEALSTKVPLTRIICQPIRQYIPHWQKTYFYLWSS